MTKSRLSNHLIDQTSFQVINNVLFLNSYSTRSTGHYNYALSLMRSLNSRLHLAHFYDTGDKRHEQAAGEYYNLGQYESMLQKIDLEEQRLLSEFVEQHTSPADHEVMGDRYVVSGESDKEACKLTSTGNFQLLIMGARKQKPSFKFLGIGLSKILVDTVNCPLLLLPEGTSVRPIKKICFASNLSPGSVEAFHLALKWARALNAEVEVLTVVREEALVKKVEVKLKTWISSLEDMGGPSISGVVRVGAPSETIQLYLQESGAEMLVVANRRRRHWLDQIKRTITKKLVESIEVPILVMKVWE